MISSEGIDGAIGGAIDASHGAAKQVHRAPSTEACEEACEVKPRAERALHLDNTNVEQPTDSDFDSIDRIYRTTRRGNSEPEIDHIISSLGGLDDDSTHDWTHPFQGELSYYGAERGTPTSRRREEDVREILLTVQDTLATIDDSIMSVDGLTAEVASSVDSVAESVQELHEAVATSMSDMRMALGDIRKELRELREDRVAANAIQEENTRLHRQGQKELADAIRGMPSILK